MTSSVSQQMARHVEDALQCPARPSDPRILAIVDDLITMDGVPHSFVDEAQKVSAFARSVVKGMKRPETASSHAVIVTAAVYLATHYGQSYGFADYAAVAAALAVYIRAAWDECQGGQIRHGM